MRLAFFATVVLLVCMGYFMLGSLPLLILKHDTPMDARFIRGLFNLYYMAVILMATVGAVGYALAQRPLFVVLMAGIAVLAVATRRVIVLGMDRLRSTMTGADAPVIARFRKLHVTGMVLNVVQLAVIAAAMTQIRI